MESVQSILLKLPEHKMQLADTLRGIICSSHPSIKENIKFGRINFHSGHTDIAFICVKAANRYIELGFFKAASLHDPAKLFEGKGKAIRRIKIHSLEEIPASQIMSWVKESMLLKNNNL
jgi:hypothetical protein